MSNTPRLPSLAFIGEESLVVQCAEIARDSGHRIVGIASGRAATREYAIAAGFRGSDATGLLDLLNRETVDVLFSIAHEYVLSEEVLAQVDTAINFHDGPLPDYAGLAVTSWALVNGETEHAVTWHTITSEVDAGEIVHTERFEIGPDETAFSLNARCYEEALASFPTVLAAVSEHVGPFAAQAARPGRWFGRYQRPLAFVDPSKPAAELQSLIRALDLGPRIRNRVGTPRLLLEDEAIAIDACEVLPASGAPIGTMWVSGTGIRIATADGDLEVRAATTLTGDDLTVEDLGLCAMNGVRTPDPRLVAMIESADEGLARGETYWSTRLARFERSEPSHLSGEASAGLIDVQIPVASGTDPAQIVTAVLTWWNRTSRAPATWFEYSDEQVEATYESLRPLVQRPIGVFEIDNQREWAAAHAEVATELRAIGDRGPFLRDLVKRDPALRHRRLDPALLIRIGSDAYEPSCTALMEAVIPADGGSLRIRLRDSAEIAHRCGEQLATLLEAGLREPSAPLAELDLVGPAEMELLDRWNSTTRPFDRGITIDGQFRKCAMRLPDAPAVTCLEVTLTYAELASNVEALAARLSSAGATRGSLVGIALERDVDLLVAVLAVLTVGAAYVPLDPRYPQDRLAFMVTDSDLAVIVAGSDDAARRFAGPAVTIVQPSSSAQHETASHDVADRRSPQGDHGSDEPAYIIYTSGSTGEPKGVVLEHRNVVNFFAAMDDVIDHDPAGTWLAVTSLSFDISVLELLWTITRGFHVVIQKHGIASPLPVRLPENSSSRRTSGATSLSLFFFAAGNEQATEGYRLLRESCQFADTHGFEAIWLPERHFHEFGAAYPNPSVVASAVAVLTDHIAIRAGSVVLPLHASARVAEEWAVVDNLSGGRVGISFAPGWQPNDFVLNPTGYATAREDLQGRIEEVRALWRGDAIDMLGPDGVPVSVTTLPRPIQRELPLWLTSAGTTKTFERAGTMGVNLLTHLLGQSVEQLADNIGVYRAAWSAAGHRGEGHVTVMLHTFISDDRDRAIRLAEEPMKRYLSSATGLIKNMASAFPTFANAGASADDAFRSLSDSELDELLTVAAARYIDTSGLFGDLSDAIEMSSTLSEMGVDEIACLIDFGLETADVLESLPLLGELKSELDRMRTVADGVGGGVDDEHDDRHVVGWSEDSMSALAERHSVTHLQCTPSLAAMLLAEPNDRQALRSIRHLLVGGEALPEKLGRDLRNAVSGRLTNMYGPTETTIWSLVHEIEGDLEGAPPIGHAIANTSIHILDESGRPLPIGALGELHIGGEGVARGYFGRDELTAERFVERPGMGRVYATGDLARIHDGGIVEFAGRVDFQVKIRGHRIELGEIEARLDLHPSVERSVVVARGEAGDAGLIAFVVLATDATLEDDRLRKFVGEALPDVMVPDLVVALESLPLTPNGKVDRAALPTDVERRAPDRPVIAPEDDVERLVAAAWTKQLNRAVGRNDNFFDIGGHSLLAVAVFRELQETSGLPIALTDVFRYPTVASFAEHLRMLGDPGRSAAASAAPSGLDRGARRRRRLAGRDR